MKMLYKILVFFFAIGIFFSCTEEEVIDVNPDFVISFERDGSMTALAGVPFYVFPTGSGEFLTLYDGTEGHVWGESSARGTFFSTADSLQVTYPSAGKYNLTVVSSSSEGYGDKLNRRTKSVEITVLDKRNSLTHFSVNTELGEYTGIIEGNEITVEVPDVLTNFKLSPFFLLDSEASKVYVGDKEQISNETINDFSSPVVYRVVSGNGEEVTYTVKVVTFPASAENELLEFKLAPYDASIGYTYSNGEIAEIDEESKTIKLKVNYGTTSRAKLLISSSYLSTVYIQTGSNINKFNPNTRYTLSSITSIQIEAQNKQRATYTLNIEDEDPLISFTFKGLVPSPIGVIDKVNKTITVKVLEGTNITKLVAEWVGSVGEVKVGGVSQENGTTQNDFSKAVTYSFYKGTTLGENYTVSVDVIK